MGGNSELSSTGNDRFTLGAQGQQEKRLGGVMYFVREIGDELHVVATDDLGNKITSQQITITDIPQKTEQPSACFKAAVTRDRDDLKPINLISERYNELYFHVLRSGGATCQFPMTLWALDVIAVKRGSQPTVFGPSGTFNADIPGVLELVQTDSTKALLDRNDYIKFNVVRRIGGVNENAYIIIPLVE